MASTKVSVSVSSFDSTDIAIYLKDCSIQCSLKNGVLLINKNQIENVQKIMKTTLGQDLVKFE